MADDSAAIAALELEVKRLGRLVDALYVQLNGAAPDGAVDASAPPADVVQALQVGNVIEAIKLWRGYTGLGLAAAKAEVEDLQSRLGL